MAINDTTPPTVDSGEGDIWYRNPGSPPWHPKPTGDPGNSHPEEEKKKLSQAEMEMMFPWLTELGLDAGTVQVMLADSSGGAEFYAKLKLTPQYKQRFIGLVRSNGQVRMNEATYIATENGYRQLLKQYGTPGDYSTPASLLGFFDGEIDQSELRDRLQTYKGINDSGQHVKDAFYVYAGMNVSTDDLYEATVDPAAGQHLSDAYNAKVAASSFDYGTWITRATELGLSRVTAKLTDLQRTGSLTGAAVQSVLSTDSSFARQIMDVLYHGGDPNGGAQLGLQDLLSSFEYAAIGGAASGVGLTMPTKIRAAEIRQAGIDRSKALSGYMQYSENQGIYAGSTQRQGTDFNQTNFEDAAFLGDGAMNNRLSHAVAQEDAAGKGSGGASFNMDREGRLTQTGMKASSSL